MSIEKIQWGNCGGEQAFLYSMVKGDLELKVCNYGCTIVGLTFHGKDVILGHTSFDALLHDQYYMGCLVGRFAGRISGSCFEIGGTLYQLPANDGITGNHLHGGPDGFNKICFDTSTFYSTDTESGITFSATSKHLDQGYPGNLLITCTITINSDNEIVLKYTAIPDQPTHINLTHHLYYNLTGATSLGEQELQINANLLVETGKHYIPTGLFVNLTQDSDFRIAKKIPVDVDYNECYVLNRSESSGIAALLTDPASGLQIQLSTSCPSIVFYSGQFLGPPFSARQGICLETQFYPDSPNNKNFPSTLYEEGENFHQYTKLAFKKNSDMKRLPFVLLFVLITVYTSAQVNIVIKSKENAIGLQTDKDGLLFISYFGAALKDDSLYKGIADQYRLTDANNSMTNNAYTPAGTWNLMEPALEIEQPDGNHSVDLKYVSHAQKKEKENVFLTSVVLKDPVYPVEVTLNYRVYFNENIIEQWAVIKNNNPKKTIKLNKYASANLYFTADKYYLRQYHGGWAEEMKPEEHELTAGIKTLDSKLGTRANLFQPPSFVLGFDGPVDEDNGDVLIGTLAWTGNFKIDFEKDVYNNLRLIAGINPYASQYHLAANSSFETPAFIYSYSRSGVGTASRNLHSWARNYRLPDGNGSRQTLLNNWEATYFDFDQEKLAGLFKGARELGVDLFLLDDGWFGNKYPRNDDRAGLGDWQENRKKLPDGVPYLVKEAEKQQIKFGIWVEPEMVNPKSELYEKHKDWVIRQPDRKEYYFRNQLVLDLTNPEVQQFVFGVLDSLLIKNPTLAFIKWDCNAVIYNAHSAWLQKKNIPQSHLYVEYVKGLYEVLTKFRKKYPDIHMMLCSGGGGRADYKALSYFTEFWPSDNTDPYERIFIQWENSFFFPAITSCNHVTDWSKASMKFRTDVAMMGKAGFDIVVDKLSENDKKFAVGAINDYKSINKIVWHGDMYRLVNPWKNNSASLMFASADSAQAVLFNYLTDRRYNNNPATVPVKLKGLAGDKRYTVEEINLYPGQKPVIAANSVFTGDFLMNVGINPHLSQSHPSVVLRVTQIQ